MKLISYGKCEQCKEYSMLVCFWYCEADTAPMYLCKDCHKELDDAMANYRDYPMFEEEYG